MELDAQTLDVELEQGGEPETTKPTLEPPKPAPTPPSDDLRAAMAELAGTVNKLAAPKDVPKQKTQEEINDEWAVWDPEKTDPEFFRKFMRLNPDMDKAEAEQAIKDYKALFGGMQKGLVKQAIIGALNVLRGEDLRKMREEFTPATEFAAQARAEKTRERFFKGYPALYTETEEGANRFAKVIDATARLLADKEFTDESSYFKALAEGAAETIKTVDPSFDLGAKPTKQSAGTTPRLPRTRVGGTGGTGPGLAPKGGAEPDDDSAAINW